MPTPQPLLSDDRPVIALLAEIDSEQSRVRQLLAGGDEPTFAARPPSGKWSVLENVRHLLFAEQLHLGRFVPGRNWSSFGYTPAQMRDVRKMVDNGSAEPRIGDVLAAWEGIHATIAFGLAGQDTAEVRRELVRNLKHLRAHALVVERLVRRSWAANSTC